MNARFQPLNGLQFLILAILALVTLEIGSAAAPAFDYALLAASGLFGLAAITGLLCALMRCRL